MSKPADNKKSEGKKEKKAVEGEIHVRTRESLERGPAEVAFRINPQGKVFVYRKSDKVHPFRSLKPAKCTLVPANAKKKEAKFAAFLDACKEDGVPDDAQQIIAMEVNKIVGAEKYMSVLCYEDADGRWVSAENHPFACSEHIDATDCLMFVGPNGVSYHSNKVPKKDRVGSSYPYAVVGVAEASFDGALDLTNAPKSPVDETVFDQQHPVIDYIFHNFDLKEAKDDVRAFNEALDQIWAKKEKVVSKRGLERFVYKYPDQTVCALLARNDNVFREESNPFLVVCAIAPLPHELRNVLDKKTLCSERPYKHLRILPGSTLKNVKYLPLEHMRVAELREPIALHATMTVLDKQQTAFVKGAKFELMQDFTICMGPAAINLAKQNAKELVHSAEWMQRQKQQCLKRKNVGLEQSQSSKKRKGPDVVSEEEEGDEEEDDFQ